MSADLMEYEPADDGTLASISRSILSGIGGGDVLGSLIARRYLDVSEHGSNREMLDYSRFVVKTVESKDRLNLDSREEEFDEATLRSMLWPLFEEKLRQDALFSGWLIDMLREHQPQLFDRVLAESQARLMVEDRS